MTYHSIDRGLADLFKVGLEAQMATKMDDWKENLEAGRLTDEMKATFTAFGWLTPRDSRPQPMKDEEEKQAPDDEAEDVTPRRRRRHEPDIDVSESAEPEEITIREPAGIGT